MVYFSVGYLFSCFEYFWSLCWLGFSRRHHPHPPPCTSANKHACCLYRYTWAPFLCVVVWPCHTNTHIVIVMPSFAFTLIFCQIMDAEASKLNANPDSERATHLILMTVENVPNPNTRINSWRCTNQGDGTMFQDFYFKPIKTNPFVLLQLSTSSTLLKQIFRLPNRISRNPEWLTRARGDSYPIPLAMLSSCRHMQDRTSNSMSWHRDRTIGSSSFFTLHPDKPIPESGKS